MQLVRNQCSRNLQSYVFLNAITWKFYDRWLLCVILRSDLTDVNAKLLTGRSELQKE